MMKKLHIILIILACCLGYTALEVRQQDDSTGSGPGRLSTAAYIEDGVNSPERYIDWNTPAFSSTVREFFSERSQNQTTGLKNHTNLKLPPKSGYQDSPGKIPGIHVLNRFEYALRLFPSGTGSKWHHLIILRKLVI